MSASLPIKKSFLEFEDVMCEIGWFVCDCTPVISTISLGCQTGKAVYEGEHEKALKKGIEGLISLGVDLVSFGSYKVLYKAATKQVIKVEVVRAAQKTVAKGVLVKVGVQAVDLASEWQTKKRVAALEVSDAKNKQDIEDIKRKMNIKP